MTLATKLVQFTADETGKGQFLRGNRRNLAGEVFMRKISFSKKVANVTNLCNGQGQWAGNMCKGECCSGFGKRVCQFISGKFSMTGHPLEVRATREERDSERSQISQNDFSWRNAGAVERKVRAD